MTYGPFRTFLNLFCAVFVTWLVAIGWKEVSFMIENFPERWIHLQLAANIGAYSVVGSLLYFVWTVVAFTLVKPSAEKEVCIKIFYVALRFILISSVLLVFGGLLNSLFSLIPVGVIVWLMFRTSSKADDMLREYRQAKNEQLYPPH